MWSGFLSARGLVIAPDLPGSGRSRPLRRGAGDIFEGAQFLDKSSQRHSQSSALSRTVTRWVASSVGCSPRRCPNASSASSSPPRPFRAFPTHRGFQAHGVSASPWRDPWLTCWWAPNDVSGPTHGDTPPHSGPPRASELDLTAEPSELPLSVHVLPLAGPRGPRSSRASPTRRSARRP